MRQGKSTESGGAIPNLDEVASYTEVETPNWDEAARRMQRHRRFP